MIFGPRAYQLIFYGDLGKEDLLERTQKMQIPKRISTKIVKRRGSSFAGMNPIGESKMTSTTVGAGDVASVNNKRPPANENGIETENSIGRERRVSSVFAPDAIAMSTDESELLTQCDPSTEKIEIEMGKNTPDDILITKASSSNLAYL